VSVDINSLVPQPNPRTHLSRVRRTMAEVHYEMSNLNAVAP